MIAHAAATVSSVLEPCSRSAGRRGPRRNRLAHIQGRRAPMTLRTPCTVGRRRRPPAWHRPGPSSSWERRSRMGRTKVALRAFDVLDEILRWPMFGKRLRELFGLVKMLSPGDQHEFIIFQLPQNLIASLHRGKTRQRSGGGCDLHHMPVCDGELREMPLELVSADQQGGQLDPRRGQAGSMAARIRRLLGGRNPDRTCSYGPDEIRVLDHVNAIQERVEAEICTGRSRLFNLREARARTTRASGNARRAHWES